MKHLLSLVLTLVLLWVAPVAGAATENETPAQFPTTLCANACTYHQMEIMFDEPERSSIFMYSQGGTIVEPLAFIQDLYAVPASQIEVNYEGQATWADMYGIQGELQPYAYFRFGVRNNYLPGPLYYYWGEELLYKPDGLLLYVDSIVVLFMQEQSSGRVFAFAMKTAQMTSPYPDGSFNGQHLFGAYEVSPAHVNQLFMSYLHEPTI